MFREYLAEFGPWTKITLPSLKALGLTTRTLNNAWIKATVVPEGRTYVSTSGETKESTTLQFLAVYPDEAACRAAYYVANAEPIPTTNGTAPADEIDFGQGPTPAPRTVAQPVQPVNDPGRKTALNFLKAIVKGAGGDVDAVEAKIAQMPLISKYFSITSPEVVEAITDYVTAQSKPF